jgi:hypothetical protein
VTKAHKADSAACGGWLWLCVITAGVIAAAIPNRALAQERKYYLICEATSGFGNANRPPSPVKVRYQTGLVEIVANNPDEFGKSKTITEVEWSSYIRSNIETQLDSKACYSVSSEAEGNQNIMRAATPRPDVRYSAVSWQPSFTTPQSSIRMLTLDFEPGDGSGSRRARRGYRSASIKLNYRFLLCANEIQVAYALDRKSLEHSQDYVDKFVGINPNYITPPSEPPVPMTVPLELKVYIKKTVWADVAMLRDGTAGEALGMGCFTGQTSKIGFVAKLIGPNATRPEIKRYLDLLDLVGMTTAAEIDTPLLNPAVPAPPAPRPAIRRKPR